MTSPSDVTVEAITDLLDEEAPAPQGFTIDSEEKAAWAVDKILSLEAAEERLTVQFEKNVQRASKLTARARDFFLPQLEAFYEANPPKKGKTLHLSTGDLAKKKKPARFTIQDDEMVVTWARATLPADLAVLVAERLELARDDLERAEARKLASEHHKKTQAEIPGCVVTPEVETFTVKSPKEG